MPELVNKEVYFNEYCNKCIHKDTIETEDPCNECLNQGHNEYSHKPINFTEGE